MTTSLTRSSFTSAALAGPVLAASNGLGAGTASPSKGSASASVDTRAQVPGVHRQSVGGITVTAVADGYAMLPLGLVPEAVPAEADALARDAFVAPGDLQCVVNTFVIDTGSHLVMVDTGFGAGGNGHSGKIFENLAAAGVDPARIDALVLTHGHPDHTSGMLREDGSAAFPNAELFVHAREVDYWTDAGAQSRAPDFQRSWFDGFRNVIAPYAARTTRVERDGQEVVPGVRFAELFGHTPGHGGLHIADGDAEHLIWTDVVHFPHLQFPRPELGVAFDVDPELAKRTRRAMLDRVSADRLSVSGMHLVFPTFGHVRRAGANAYAFEPARWQYDLQRGPAKPEESVA